MKMFRNIIDILLAMVGIVWILQGFNILPDNFMLDQILYAILGLAAAMIAAVLLTYANRRSRDIPEDSRSKPDR